MDLVYYYLDEEVMESEEFKKRWDEYSAHEMNLESVCAHFYLNKSGQIKEMRTSFFDLIKESFMHLPYPPDHVYDDNREVRLMWHLPENIIDRNLSDDEVNKFLDVLKNMIINSEYFELIDIYQLTKTEFHNKEYFYKEHFLTEKFNKLMGS